MNYMQPSFSARMQRFGAGAVILQARPGASLSDDEIMHGAPTVFASEAHESRSERFVHIPTARLLSGMRAEGFLPTRVMVGGSRDEGKRAYTKHLIRFRRAQDLDSAPVVGASVPEAVLLNAHDGTSSYRLMLGIFRLICSNGMIVGDNVRDVRIPHSGDATRTIGKVIEGTYSVLGESGAALESIGSMTGVQLDAGERQAFARAALALRYDDDEMPRDLQDSPERVLQARRAGDVGSDLWATFNRAQENLVRGGISYRHESRDDDGRIRRRSYRETRPVRSVDGDVRLNRALWTLAEEMRRLKAA